MLDLRIPDPPLVSYVKSVAPMMTSQEIMDAIKRPRGRIKYEPVLLPQVDGDQLQKLVANILPPPNLDQDQKQQEVLELLRKIVRDWSQDIAHNERKISANLLDQCSAVLLPYGSILLGVADNKSDIDLVCVAVEFIERGTHFFQKLFDILAQQEGMEQINKIASTSNPIIKMIFRGIRIDISFAQLNSDTIPENIDERLDQLRSNLNEMEGSSLNALNGRKNGILIHNSTPNHAQFSETLRYVKLWAKRRAITSNIIGYLGGISWAILVAKVCQLFPDLSPALTFVLFLQTYSLWDWRIPIIIDDSDPEIPRFSGRSWREDEPKHEVIYMQVITPAYPFFNSTFKVSQITFSTITYEFRRAAQARGDWNVVLQEFDFFNYFQFYLVLSIVGRDQKQFHKWTGFCEAQLPKLMKGLFSKSDDLEDQDKLEDQAVQEEQDYEFRLSPNAIPDLERSYTNSLSYFMGIRKLKPEAWPLMFRKPITYFARKLNDRMRMNKFETPDFNLLIYRATKEDIDALQARTPDGSPMKKVKIDPQSAEHQNRVSMESVHMDTRELRSVLDDMF